MVDLRLGDCIEELKKLPDNGVNYIITSPPYWKGFEINKQWFDIAKNRLNHTSTQIIKKGSLI